MPTQGRSSTAIRTASIAGLAAAGAAFWMAGSASTDVATAVPQVQLTGSAGGNGTSADG